MKLFHIHDFSPYSSLFPELSDMQLKVFVLYNNYVSPENITRQLNITINTLYVHLKRIRDKYDVDSSSELKQVYNRRKEAYLMYLLRDIRI